MARTYRSGLVERADLLAACRVLTGDFADQAKTAAHWLHQQFESGAFGSMRVYGTRTASGRIVAALSVHLDGAAGATVLGYRTEPTARAADDDLIASALADLSAAGVKVLQLIAKPDQTERYASFPKHGVQPTCTMVEMTRPIEPGIATPPVSGLTLRPFRDSEAVVFRDVLIATYEGTLDCPELNDVRTPDETLASLRGHSQGNDPFWFRADINGSPAGVLLLNPGQSSPQWELTYLGLTPAYRQRGFGKTLLAVAIARASQGGATSMILTTDRRNEPALCLYERAGFQRNGDYAVYLKTFRAS